MPQDNPQLIEHCNDEFRQLADICVALRIRVQAQIEEYVSRGLTSIVTAGGLENPILDGSATDGRTIATGNDVLNMATLLSDLDTFFNAGRVDVLYKWQVNGNRL